MLGSLSDPACSVPQATVDRTAQRNPTLASPNPVTTRELALPHLEASTVPAPLALWGCAVRGTWTSVWSGPATLQAPPPATLWPTPTTASVCLDTQGSGVRWRSTPARASPAPTEGPVRPQLDSPQVSLAAAPRVLKAPPAATEPLPAASTTATMEACACPPLSQACRPSAPASMAMGTPTA